MMQVKQRVTPPVLTEGQIQSGHINTGKSHSKLIKLQIMALELTGWTDQQLNWRWIEMAVTNEWRTEVRQDGMPEDPQIKSAGDPVSQLLLQEEL